MGKAKEIAKKGLVLGLTGLTALQLAKGQQAFGMGGATSGIAKEAKPFRVADAKEITEDFEKAWAEMQARYSGKMGAIPLPGKVTFKPLKQDRYLSELSVEGGNGAFIAGPSAVIVKAMTKDSIFVSYPEGMKMGKSQMDLFALFAYISVALDGYSYQERLLFPLESVQYLYLETMRKGKPMECGSIYATVGLVAYAVDPDNPFELVRLLAADDVASIKKAVDRVCGNGFWDSMRHVPEGSPLLNAITDAILKMPDGAKTMGSYLKFMETHFNADASALFAL